jgi:chromosome segregation ATPase
MDLEQLTKRLEWLDEERRKDKNTISAMEEHIASLEKNITQQLQQTNEITGDVARMISMESRIADLEGELAKVRVDLGRSIEAVEKQRSEHERDVEKIRQGDIERIYKTEQENHKISGKLEEIRKALDLRKEEEIRMNRSIEELRKIVEESASSNDEIRRSFKIMEDSRRTDSKRLADLTGEGAALRKRVEEQRGKQDVFAETLRKIDLKTTELMNTDSERRQAQIAFIEKQNMSAVERDRIWKDWQLRFDEIDKKSGVLDTQIQTLENTIRTVKRSQDMLDEVTQRFERRINEITEMQRLNEDRFRNEWNGFKADDLKRWANFSLTQEEMQRETVRTVQKLNERMVVLEDNYQDLQYSLQQSIDQNRKRLQSIITMINAWSGTGEGDQGG